MDVDGGIVVETQSGIGFEIFVPANSPVYRYKTGDSVMVYTSMVVKEDDISLYGFHNRESMELFEKLITVSGIGAKGAMALIGTFTTEELKRAIAFEDAKTLSRASGIGKKTAERIILELKDKMGSLGGEISTGHLQENYGSEQEAADARSDAVIALTALGYTKAEAFNAVAVVNEEGLTSEEYIKKALKNLF